MDVQLNDNTGGGGGGGGGAAAGACTGAIAGATGRDMARRLPPRRRLWQTAPCSTRGLQGLPALCHVLQTRMRQRASLPYALLQMPVLPAIPVSWGNCNRIKSSANHSVYMPMMQSNVH